MTNDLHKLYEAVFAASPDAVVVVDYLGIIIMVNDKTDSMFGYDKQELIGRSVEVLIPERFARSHQDYRQTYSDHPVERQMHNGYVLSALKKDSSEFHVEIGLKPIKIGRKTFIVASIKELSTKKTIENNVQKMIEDVQDFAILFTDIDGDITNWNKGVKRIKGYSEDEIIGQNLQIFHTTEDRKNKKHEKLLDEAIRNGKAEDEGWRVRKDGSKFWAYVSITAIHDDLQHFIGFSQITRDLTQHKTAEDLLKHQADGLKVKNKELEHFAYIASHDLQEPLSTVTSMIDLIVEEEDISKLNEDTQTYFTFMEEAVSRMRDLVKGLLDYSRLGKNKKLVKTDMNKILDDVQMDLSNQIQSVDAIIEVGEMPTIKVFDVEIRVVFQNLISNALKFIKPGKAANITVQAEDTGKYWQFSIQDNGIGIKEKHLNRIFVIFQRLNTEDKYKGTGIGLAHCNKVAEMHGGTIWVESEFGEGSTFFFTILKKIKEEEVSKGN